MNSERTRFRLLTKAKIRREKKEAVVLVSTGISNPNCDVVHEGEKVPQFIQVGSVMAPRLRSNDMSDKAKPDNRTVAQKRRSEYQEKQREYLRGLGLIEAVQADIDREIPADKLPEVKWRNDTRLKLINKILPDLKAVEVANPDGEEFKVSHSGALVETAAALAKKIQGG